MKKIKMEVIDISYAVEGKSPFPIFIMKFIPSGFPMNEEGRKDAKLFLSSLVGLTRDIKTNFYVEVKDDE